MNFEITQESQYAVVSTKVDKLDAANAPELKSELLLLNKAGINTIILDLSKTKYCDSSGLSAILSGNRLCKDSNGQFVIAGLQDNVAKMITIAQLDRVFSITETKELAIALIAN